MKKNVNNKKKNSLFEGSLSEETNLDYRLDDFFEEDCLDEHQGACWSDIDVPVDNSFAHIPNQSKSSINQLKLENYSLNQIKNTSALQENKIFNLSDQKNNSKSDHNKNSDQDQLLISYCDAKNDGAQNCILESKNIDLFPENNSGSNNIEYDEISQQSQITYHEKNFNQNKKFQFNQEKGKPINIYGQIKTIQENHIIEHNNNIEHHRSANETQADKSKSDCFFNQQKNIRHEYISDAANSKFSINSEDYKFMKKDRISYSIIDQEKPFLAKYQTLKSPSLIKYSNITSESTFLITKKSSKNMARRNKMFLLEEMQIIRTIGAGTFGRVYLVKYNGRYYALKRVKKEFLVKFKQIDHLFQERKALSDLFFCKYFVKLIQTFQTDTTFFLLLEYIAGGELFYWLRKYNSFLLKDTRFYSAQIILALEYLFSKKLIYRDLKPENILLTANGHIKLIDLGFAKNIDTLTFTICGTPEYMAPEKLKGIGYDKASDIWTFGVLIYEMLSGKPPFIDESNVKIYEKILNDDPSYHHMDLVAVDLVEQLLVKDPHYRLINTEKIKSHRFFANIFSHIDEIEPPIVPLLVGEGDSQYYVRYPEEQEHEEEEQNLYYSFE